VPDRCPEWQRFNIESETNDVYEIIWHGVEIVVHTMIRVLMSSWTSFGGLESRAQDDSHAFPRIGYERGFQSKSMTSTNWLARGLQHLIALQKPSNGRYSGHRASIEDTYSKYVVYAAGDGAAAGLLPLAVVMSAKVFSLRLISQDNAAGPVSARSTEMTSLLPELKLDPFLVASSL